jgi:hypothetical protein
VDRLMKSLSRFARQARVVEGVASGRLRAEGTVKIGPALVLERAWERCGAGEVIGRLLDGRGFEFPVERAVFLSVAHRLFEPGSDRQAERWKAEHRIEGAEGVRLHHLYRAMRWLREERERIEKGLFGRRQTPAQPRILSAQMRRQKDFGEGGPRSGGTAPDG